MFENAAAEPLGAPSRRLGICSIAALDRAAALTAFEQIGGADRALEMARDYALDRMAFGRQIGSFQAIKHMLADIYVANTLARSNAYYGAWALTAGSRRTRRGRRQRARLGDARPIGSAAKNNMQAHGGIGFTWEHDAISITSARNFSPSRLVRPATGRTG